MKKTVSSTRALEGGPFQEVSGLPRKERKKKIGDVEREARQKHITQWPTNALLRQMRSARNP